MDERTEKWLTWAIIVIAVLMACVMTQYYP